MRVACIAELNAVAGETALGGAYIREIVEAGDDIVGTAGGGGFAYVVIFDRQCDSLPELWKRETRPGGATDE